MERLAYKWQVMVTVAVGVWMIVLDSTVVNVAFPTLRRTFGAGVDQAQWVISIYVLALGIATPLAGFLADRFGIKRVYGAGLAVFVFGSLLAGFAPNLWSLIGARAVQGFGGGIAQPLSVAMLFMAFPPREQGHAFGIFGVVMIGAPALGPILGGLLVDRDLWRWIFFINIPIGLLGITLAAWLLRPQAQKRLGPLNPLSVIGAAMGFGCTLYGASISSRYGWSSAQVLSTLGVGAGALAMLAVIELRFSREPLLDLRLFSDRTFLNANVVGYIAVLALFGAEFLMPVYLQVLRGRTALQSGLILLPIAIAAGTMNPIAGRLYDRIGPRVLVVTGSVVLLVNTWQFARLTASTGIETLVVLLALRGLAISLIMQATFTAALGAVPHRSLPRASSLVNSTRFIAQALGVAILGAVFSGTLSPEVRRLQQEQNNGRVTADTAGLCEGNVEGGNYMRRDDPQTQEACLENLRGLRRAYTVTFYAALVAIVAGAFLPGWPSKWTGRDAQPSDGGPG
jgi:EmrB/QacA subfamily drug resistance transporter